MKLQVVDTKGKILREDSVSDDVFGIVPNESVMSQYLHVYRSNQRQGTASSKTRGEVHGTGRKPWRQKGTGRARVGTRTNPLWRHGGIAHGPKPKSWTKRLSKKIISLAFRSAISYKASNGKVQILDGVKIETPSTKDIQGVIDNVYKGDFRKLLFVLESNDQNFVKSARNIMNVRVVQVSNVNTFEILNSSDILLVGSAHKVLEDKYTAPSARKTKVKKVGTDGKEKSATKSTKEAKKEIAKEMAKDVTTEKSLDKDTVKNVTSAKKPATKAKSEKKDSKAAKKIGKGNA